MEKQLWPDAKQETNSLLCQVNLTAKSIIITPNDLASVFAFRSGPLSSESYCTFSRGLGVLTQHPGLITSVYQNLIIPQKKCCFLRRLKHKQTHTSLSSVYNVAHHAPDRKMVCQSLDREFNLFLRSCMFDLKVDRRVFPQSSLGMY